MKPIAWISGKVIHQCENITGGFEPLFSRQTLIEELSLRIAEDELSCSFESMGGETYIRGGIAAMKKIIEDLKNV